MDDMVKELNLQKTYICRLFRMFNYESPYKYLLRKKMNHALNMLINTNTLVRIIAHEIGFNDPYHFSKVFKKMFMMSPKKFRQITEKKKKILIAGDYGLNKELLKSDTEHRI